MLCCVTQQNFFPIFESDRRRQHKEQLAISVSHCNVTQAGFQEHLYCVYRKLACWDLQSITNDKQSMKSQNHRITESQN